MVTVLNGTPGRTLLEVGSGSRGVAAFVTGWQITACDVSFDDYGGGDAGRGLTVTRIVGSVLALPFPDAGFDVVLALDLLEHITPEDRSAALGELRRVSASTLIVGCPCGPDAEASDRRLAEFYRRRGNVLPGWLDEHLRHGLPAVEEPSTAARPGDVVASIPNANTRSHEHVLRWEATPGLATLALLVGIGLRQMLAHGRLSARVGIAVLRLLGGGNREPAYRRIAVIRGGESR